MDILTANNITVSFDDKVILNDVSMLLPKGRITAIIGPNGSGKSTLLKAVSRNIKPQQGKVFFAGRDLAKMKHSLVAREMAVLPQTPLAPPDLTVRDLVEYGRYPHRSWWKRNEDGEGEIIEQAMRQTGVGSMSDRLISTLSGGERQRVWIAMAIAQQPQLLLLDEPTTYLDVSHQLEIMELLKRLNEERGLTVGMVIHEINHAAAYAHQVVVLKDGRVAMAGSPQEAIEPTLLRSVFGVESEIAYTGAGKMQLLITGLHKEKNDDKD